MVVAGISEDEVGSQVGLVCATLNRSTSRKRNKVRRACSHRRLALKAAGGDAQVWIPERRCFRPACARAEPFASSPMCRPETPGSAPITGRRPVRTESTGVGDGERELRRMQEQRQRALSKTQYWTRNALRRHVRQCIIRCGTNRPSNPNR